MRWRIVWLAAVLAVTTRASKIRGTITIEHDLLQKNNVSPGAFSTVKFNSVTSEEAKAISVTEEAAQNSKEVTYTKAASEEKSTVKEWSADSGGVECCSEEQRKSDETSDENSSKNGPEASTVTVEENDVPNVNPTAVPTSAESGAEIGGETGGEGEGEADADDVGSGDAGSGDAGSGEEGIIEPEEILPPNEDLIIQTKSGSVQGYPWQGKGNIISYIDIPYGTIGQNPFQTATPATAWKATHNVKDHNKRCPQLQDDNYVGDMDCLTLSIFKPLDVSNASVLFHIHAENFNTGSGDPYIYGPDYLVASGIILVLPNYRLGPLGFLCMQNDTAPGNMGLKDLSLALTWIHDNIKAFGGNPDNIAVSGDGRSGALAGLMALSPMSKDSISKVIAESGSFLSYWALDRDPTVTVKEFLKNINDVDRAYSSIGELTVKEIVTAANGTNFRPCLEIDAKSAFLTKPPYVAIEGEKVKKTFLIGSAVYAGVHEALLQTEDSIKQFNEDSTLLLPNDLIFRNSTLRGQVGKRVKTQYFGEEPIKLEDVKNLSLCFTDIGYLGPGIRSARALVEAGATVYFYEFVFVGELNRVLDSVNRPVDGAVKGDIVGYLFTQDGVVPGEQQVDESKMVDTLTKMWTNFLKTGTPSTDTIKWNKLEKKGQLEEEWLLIDSEPSMKKGLHVDRLLLWTEIYEKHFIDGNFGNELSPSVSTVLVFQLIFWIGFFMNASHIN